MGKRFLISWLVVFVAWFLGSFVVHGVLLRPDYMELKHLFRPEEQAQQFMPLMALAHVIMAGAFTWIYSRGREAKPWLAQGVRYGVAVALLGVVPTYMIYYVVQPMPAGTVIRQIVFDGALVVLLGVVVAWMYRKVSATFAVPATAS
jgi:hypothetical protein